jgi:hypothetical protein
VKTRHTTEISIPQSIQTDSMETEYSYNTDIEQNSLVLDIVSHRHDLCHHLNKPIDVPNAGAQGIKLIDY